MGTTNLLLRAASEALQRPPSCSGPTPPLSPRTATPSATPSTPGSIMGSFVSTPLTPPTGLQQRQQLFSITVDVIRSEHVSAARTAVRNPRLLKELEAGI